LHLCESPVLSFLAKSAKSAKSAKNTRLGSGLQFSATVVSLRSLRLGESLSVGFRQARQGRQEGKHWQALGVLGFFAISSCATWSRAARLCESLVLIDLAKLAKDAKNTRLGRGLQLSATVFSLRSLRSLRESGSD